MKLTKRLLFNLCLNLAFALNSLFGQSMISLLLLFTMFVATVGILVNLAYMALNDKQSA